MRRVDVVHVRAKKLVILDIQIEKWVETLKIMENLMDMAKYGDISKKVMSIKT